MGGSRSPVASCCPPFGLIRTSRVRKSSSVSQKTGCANRRCRFAIDIAAGKWPKRTGRAGFLCCHQGISTHTPRSLHIESVRKSCKGKTCVSHLLRRSCREGSKVEHETLGTLNDLPADLIAVMRERLASGQPIACSSDSIAVLRSTPHGHVAAVLETMQTLGFEKLISSTATRERSLVLAMIADRTLSPGSKLSCCPGGGSQFSARHALRRTEIRRCRSSRTLRGHGLVARTAEPRRKQACQASFAGWIACVIRCIVQFLHWQQVRPYPAWAQP